MRPHSPEQTLDNPAGDLAVCRQLLRAGSKSFSAASRLLPAEVRDSATILYAFCRDADDAVDLHGGGVHVITGLRERLHDLYSGTPRPFATDRALADVVRRHSLPKGLLDALIEGFEWDAQGRRYATLEELEAYAARVAGTIGAMMAVLMGVRSPSAIARACDLGVAMQLTNIARDVGEDARAGRIYLPLDWLVAEGIDPQAWLLHPQPSEGVRRTVLRLLRAADRLYERVDQGVAQLPGACRPGINAARWIYAEIGHRVVRCGGDSVSRRAVVPAHRKAWLLVKSFLPLPEVVQSECAPPLTATSHLVDAVMSTGSADIFALASGRSALAWWDFRAQAVWMIDLFERLERRERMAPKEATRLQHGSS